MDYVYICRHGDNEELRYSLRSIEKNMPAGDVWVFGYRPDWYIGNFIKVEDSGGKFDNIKNCILHIVENKDISDNFILMNDDFFALKKIQNFKNYNGGFLENKIKKYKELRMSPKYIKLLELTLKQLKNRGIDNPIDYDIHTPMSMNKKILKDCIDFAYFPRSTYGNFAKVDSLEISDVKIYSKNKTSKLSDILSHDFISTEDSSFILLKKTILANMFTEPSRFENPNY